MLVKKKFCASFSFERENDEILNLTDINDTVILK